MIADPILHLFALCTHLEQTPSLRQEIAVSAARISDWTMVPALAEKHGMAPLLKRNLGQAVVSIPGSAQRDLLALTLRHRLINQVRSRALSDLVCSFQQADLPYQILKGAALAYILYPEPGLRPMKDMDILVCDEDLKQVCDLLQQAGYKQNGLAAVSTDRHHLPEFHQLVDGFTLTIEIHNRLLLETSAHPWGRMEDMHASPMQFSLPDGEQATTLGPADMLYHLCRHTFYDNHALESLCMIWVADIINLAEKFVGDIDWAIVERDYPQVQHILTSLNEVRPLSDALIQYAHLNPQPTRRQSFNPYLGWPAAPLSRNQTTGVPRWLWETFFPSAWWLRLRYGGKQPAPVFWDWVAHLRNLVTEATRRTLKRIKHRMD
jgi:hypothetical protein